MPEAEVAAVGYCTACGAALHDDACPIHGLRPSEDHPDHAAVASPNPRRRGIPLLLSLLVGALVVSNALTWISVRGELRSVRHQAASDSSDAAARLAGLRTAADRLEQRVGSVEASNETLTDKIGAVEGVLDRIPDAVAVIRKARESVFTVFAGPFEGSAFAIGRDGGRTLLITNFHVIASNWDAGRASAEVVQGEDNYTGRIERVRRADDLALLSIPAAGYVPLIAATDRVQVGDPVIALGSPFGLEGTASSGIVSAVRDGFVQFSAAISPGSSGGPLLDAHGRVIGVNTAKVSSVGAEGLSFAIPIGVACDVLVNC